MKVFVYGTLKQGFHNHDFIEASGGKFVGGAWLDNFMMTDGGHGWFPVALKGDGYKMYGEVYEVDTLVHTDYLEGYPTHYDRELVKTEHGEAWVYFQHDTASDALLIGDGVW